MSDVYWFDQCPSCKAKIIDRMGMPGLCGYEGNTVKCSKCKTKFRLEMKLVKVKNEKTK